MSRIEQLISEIETYIDSCKPQPFSGNKKIVVEKDVIDEMLVELRMQTPDEIKKYQKIIANKDAILADAKEKADTIVADANKQAEIIISEHAIVTQAQANAQAILAQAQQEGQSIVDSANYDAQQIRQGAIAYTDNELKMLQNLLTSTVTNTEARYNGFIKQLSDTLEVVASNRAQLEGASAEDQASSAGKIDVSI